MQKKDIDDLKKSILLDTFFDKERNIAEFANHMKIGHVSAFSYIDAINLLKIKKVTEVIDFPKFKHKLKAIQFVHKRSTNTLYTNSFYLKNIHQFLNNNENFNEWINKIKELNKNNNFYYEAFSKNPCISSQSLLILNGIDKEILEFIKDAVHNYRTYLKETTYNPVKILMTQFVK